MPLWSRVFNRSSFTRTVTGNACSTDCYNSTSPSTSGVASVLDNIPALLATVSEAIGYWAELVRRRLAATAIMTSSTDSTFTVVFRRGARVDTTTWQTSNNTGTYPLMVAYTSAADSGSARFENAEHAVDWLVDRLV